MIEILINKMINIPTLYSLTLDPSMVWDVWGDRKHKKILHTYMLLVCFDIDDSHLGGFMNK